MGEREQQLCGLAPRIRAVLIHTILWAFMHFGQAVDLQYFHLFFEVI